MMYPMRRQLIWVSLFLLAPIVVVVAVTRPKTDWAQIGMTIGAVLLGAGLLGVLLVGLARIVPRRPTVGWHDGILHWLPNAPTGGRTGAIADLRRVHCIRWDVNLFVPAESAESLAFYDREPDLELSVLGFMPRDHAATRLGHVSFRNLRRSPEALHALAEWVNTHHIPTNVASPDLEPIPEKLPPLAPGTSINGRLMVYRPPSEPPERH